MDLFCPLIPNISFSALANFTFDDWKANGTILDNDNLDTIKPYYDKEYNELSTPYYHCLPIFNTITNEHSYKFIIVEKDNDELLIVFKVISFIKIKLIKIMDKPISKLGNTENEKEIIKLLEKQNYFKFTYKEKYDNYFTNRGELSRHDCDYFYDWEIQKEKYTNKYIKKNGFNRFDSDKFRVEFTQTTNLDELHNLRQVWEKTKLDGGVDVTTKLNKFDKIMKNINGDKQCIFINIYYENELVLNYCSLLYPKHCVNLYRTSISRTSNNPEEDSWLRNTFSRLDKYATYRFIKYLKETYNISLWYYCGTNPTNVKLMDYKDAHSTGRITYLTQNSARGNENVEG